MPAGRQPSYVVGKVVNGIEILDVQSEKYGRLFKVSCPECSNTIWRTHDWFRSVNRNCGCRPRKSKTNKDLSGTTKDGARLLNRVGLINPPRYMCECSCNKIFEIRLQVFLKNQTVCCPECRRAFINGVSNEYFQGIKARARIKNLEMNITQEYMGDLFKLQRGICKLSGRKMILRSYYKDENTASLDRIDSSKGYTVGNVQWVHKDMNTMKLDWSDSEFIEACKEVARHNTSIFKIPTKNPVLC